VNFNEQQRHVVHFYELLDQLENNVGGKRQLKHVDGKKNWPRRGVYFFFEPGEYRTTSGEGLRVVRVGTHALKSGSKSTLWGRLSQHQGTIGGNHPGGGNHRGSIFRLHVGHALIHKNQWKERGVETWSVGSSALKEVREAEVWIEKAVSVYIRSMPFLWLEIDDPPGRESMRGYIESNAIALLSNYPHVGTPKEILQCIDPPSNEWLGRWAKSEKVSRSGLWNSNHVDEDYDRGFLDEIDDLIDRM
jgi:hypothetical protein